MAFAVPLVFLFVARVGAQGTLRGGASANATGARSVSVRQVSASGFTFDCHVAGEGGAAGDVMLLHGFPHRSATFEPMMQRLASAGYRSVACDQRGYSPGASPDRMEEYRYDKLRDDVFAVATAVGFGSFHIVGYDHGALLGWYAAASKSTKHRVLSLSALSFPHADAFSAGVYGENADVKQQAAAQYMTMFVEEDAAYRRLRLLCRHSREYFKTCAELQRALWWYRGAVDAGVVALVPAMGSTALLRHGLLRLATLRILWRDSRKPGHAAHSPIGPVAVPTLFVCGTSDEQVLCTRPYARATETYCTGDYQRLDVDCGHELLACPQAQETERVISAVLKRLAAPA